MLSSGHKDSLGGENLSGYNNSDVIAESSMADVQRKRRLMVGPTPSQAVSYEMTTRCAVTKEAFSFSCVVGLMGPPVGLPL